MRCCGFAARFFSPGRVAAATNGFDDQADPDKEIFDNLWRQRRLLPPTDSQYSKRRRLQYLLLLFTTYEQIYIPLQLAFQVPVNASGTFELPIAQFILQLAIDAAFMLDIVLHFRTTLYGRAEEGSVVITDTKVIFQKYTRAPYFHRGFFLYDLLACLPIDLVAFGLSGGVFGVNGQWLRANRLLHGLRIVSVHGGQVQRMSRIKKIGVYGLLWLFQAHLTACIWWAIGVADFNFRAATKMGILPWPLRIQTDGLGEAITLSSGFAMQYWSSLYWSVTTLVKVPWIRPRTTPELVFAAFVVVTGTFTFSVIIGQVTMLQKAWDMSRQARTDRIGKMRLFCNTRGVPADLTHEVLHWTVADQEFSSGFIGRASVYKLPYTMRHRILSTMYKTVLETFPFNKMGMTAEGVNVLLTKFSPLVLTRGMGLIEPNTISNVLYVLQKGCLRIALPKKEGVASTRNRSARISMSPTRGVKGGGLGIKSTKKFQSFCVLERPGSSVGIADIARPNLLYPFYVDCTATTKVFCITADGLRSAIGEMDSQDAEKCRRVLKKEHKAHVDGLKFDESTYKVVTTKEEQLRRLGARGGKSEGQIDNLIQTGNTLDALQARCQTCFDGLSKTYDQTRVLTDLIKKLGGDTDGTDGGVRTPAKPAKGVMFKGGAGQSARAAAHQAQRNQTAGDYDELEERTGYGSNQQEGQYRSAAATARTMT